MKEKINDLVSRIFNNDGTEETCFSLEEEMNELLKDAPTELQNEFVESGAGELIYMLCSGFRYEKNAKESI